MVRLSTGPPGPSVTLITRGVRSPNKTTTVTITLLIYAQFDYQVTQL